MSLDAGPSREDDLVEPNGTLPEDPNDAAAIEHIRGFALSQDWPPDALPAGTRVKVLRDKNWDGPWQREFYGAISAMGAPEPIDHPMAHPQELAYWVTFEEPQFDCDGDGPYRKAEVWGRYLQPEQ
jgi:hypothetical protein